MSIKNLPMLNYLTAQTSVHAALLAEIRVVKEESINNQLEAYKNELQEEFQKALEDFRDLQKNLESPNLLDAQNVTSETEVSEEAFIENLQLINKEKIETLSNTLYKDLELQLRILNQRTGCELVREYCGKLKLDRLSSTYWSFFNPTENLDTFVRAALDERANFWYLLENFLNKLPVNSFVDPLIVLFFLRVNYGNLRTFEKFKKVKLRKYKMKRKKIRKLYVFRKLKRIVLFRNVKKRFYKQKSFTEIFYKFFTNSSSKVLVQRIPVSTRVIEATSVDFFYKLNKKRNSQLWEDFETVDEYQTDFLIYLRNYHQKPYHKLRKARIAHWKLFFNKTLRKQRYKGFINRFVKKSEKLSYALNYFVNVFTKIKFSWSRIEKLESFFKLYIVEYSRHIIRVPMVFSKIFKWKILRTKSLLLRKKMGRWSYLNFRRATCPWLQRKKNTPKFNYHIQPNLYYFNSMAYWDVMTGFIYIDESVRSHCVPPVSQFKSNLLVKLHMYRYKANSKCMWH